VQNSSTSSAEIAAPLAARRQILAAEDRPLLGIVVLVTGIAVLPAMDAIAKHLAGHLPVLEIAWARFLFYTLALLPIALRQYKGALWKPARPGLQVLRGGLMAFSALMFFSAIKYMPLADSMAVFFVYPFLILLGSAILLREPIGYLRWIMVIIGFVGTALVVRPSVGEISIGVPFSFASGIAYAGAMLVTRKLGSHDPALVTSAISALLGAAVYSLLMPFIWVTPDLADWPLMALMGIIAAIGHFMIVQPIASPAPRNWHLSAIPRSSPRSSSACLPSATCRRRSSGSASPSSSPAGSPPCASTGDQADTGPGHGGHPSLITHP